MEQNTLIEEALQDIYNVPDDKSYRLVNCFRELIFHLTMDGRLDKKFNDMIEHIRSESTQGIINELFDN